MRWIIMVSGVKSIVIIAVWTRSCWVRILVMLQPPFFYAYIGFTLQLKNITYLDYANHARSHLINVLLSSTNIDRSNLIVTHGFDCSNSVCAVIVVVVMN